MKTSVERNSIEQFIIAGEEAWQNKEPAFHHKFVSANQYWAVFLDANGTEYTEAVSTFLIDPKMWIAFGKTMGWGDEIGVDDRNFWLGTIDWPEVSDEGKAFREVWHFKMLWFVHLLADGLPLEASLEKVIKK